MLANQIEHSLWDDLAGALSRQEFSLHYQPQVDVDSGLIIGSEALVRWAHPTLGMVPPDQFIPIAEDAALMHSLGRWILQAACEQTRMCSLATRISLRIAVNLSPMQLYYPSFVQEVMDTLQQTGLHPEQLELEITEQAFLALNKQNLTKLDELRAFGVGIVLEDVGHHMASLPQFMQIKFDKVKIDPLLVRQGHVNLAAQDKIISLLAYARLNDVKILAEGIETQEQFDWIRSHGTDEAQGYFFGRPQPANILCAEYLASVELV
jgi:EAL domain-containing protein (putative c-di-GMP-specific phosphodiesterase class I)